MIDLSRDNLNLPERKEQKIRISSSWQYAKEVSPSFKRLMMLLLKPAGNKPAKTLRPDEERQND